MKNTLLFLLIFSNLLSGMERYNPTSLKFLATKKVAELEKVNISALPEELKEDIKFLKEHLQDLDVKESYGLPRLASVLPAAAAACENRSDMLRNLIIMIKPYNPGVCRYTLHAAIGSGDYDDCVQILLEHGVSAYDRNQSGHSGLHWAALHGRSRCLELLLKDKFEDTPINRYYLQLAVHDVIAEGFSDCLTLLIEHRHDYINFKSVITVLKQEHNVFAPPTISNVACGSNGRIACMEMLGRYGWSLGALYSILFLNTLYPIERFSDKCLALESINERFGKKATQDSMRLPKF